MRTAFLVVVLSSAMARAEPAARRVTGRVVDPAGQPVGGVTVFAADAETDALVELALCDEAGRFELRLPRRRHNFGILSSRLGLVRLTPRARSFELMVRPLPPSESSQRAEKGASWFSTARASVLRGRVVDEGGTGLAGVRLEVVRKTGVVTSVIVSGAGGRFGVFLPAGDSWVRASAPGLETVRSRREDAGLIIVMSVPAELQTVTVGDHTLTFRPGDSIDPEYAPPAVVRTYLAFAYGICPATGPLRAQEKAALRKYWYLDVLRSEPPNPATVSSASCLPAAEYRLPPDQTTVGGFQIWREGVPGGEQASAHSP